MRIIDERGRLFGKINVIDFTVILFLLLLVPMFYVGAKILKKPAKVEINTRLTVSINAYALFKDLDPEVAKLISAGDKELDANGNVIAEILEVGKVEPNFVDIRLSQTNVITKEDTLRRQVTAKLMIIGKLDGSDILYKENRVKIDSEINFATAKYIAKGIIIPEPSRHMQISKPGFNLIILDALFKNLSPDVANLISVGDFEANKDGDTIAKVLNVGAIEPYTYRVDLGGGNYITKSDPQKKLVQVRMELMGGVEGNAFYFRDRRIALDSEIEFNTNEYNVEGVIIREPIPTKTLVKIPIILDALFKNLSPDVANLISVGDFEANKDGDTIAKVLNVGAIEPYTYRVDLGGGNYITKSDPQKKLVQVRMELMGGVEGNAFYFRDRRIALDSEIEFNTNEYNVEGMIIQEPFAVKKVDKKWLLLKVRFANVMPELVKVVKQGDEERDGTSGNLTAKIESVISINPAEAAAIVISDIDQRLNVVSNSSNQDIILLIKASCVKTEKGLFFKEVPVKIGNNVSLRMDKYDLTGKLIEINEVND